MTTKQHCLTLLNEVDEAGRDPQLAYLVRTRLRRALVGLERGRRDQAGDGMLGNAPEEVEALAADLAARVVWLCQPSEALDVRWKREWSGVLRDVGRLREWVSQQPERAVVG